MLKLTATYRIVTPMFIGGANQKPDDGIRPPSIKGVLRFWWRALNWGRFCEEKNHNEIQALHALHQEEARLFGAAMDEKKKIGGQGCFLLSVKQPTNLKTLDDWPPDKQPNHGASYMAYGLLETQDEYHRIAIKEGVDFILNIIFKRNANADDVQQIQETLEVWSLFGGLGSRSRRGMGSITLTNVNNESVLMNKSEYAEKVENLLMRFKNIPLSPFTAFSQKSVFYIINTGKKARTLIQTIGADYKAFRSQKKMKGKIKIPFGLPLEEVSDPNERRSSPLFFHLHQLKHNNIALAIFYLPASEFHPNKQYQNVSMNVVKQFIAEVSKR